MRRQSQKVAVAIQDGKDSLEIFERILTSSSFFLSFFLSFLSFSFLSFFLVLSFVVVVVVVVSIRFVCSVSFSYVSTAVNRRSVMLFYFQSDFQPAGDFNQFCFALICPLRLT